MTALPAGAADAGRWAHPSCRATAGPALLSRGRASATPRRPGEVWVAPVHLFLGVLGCPPRGDRVACWRRAIRPCSWKACGGRQFPTAWAHQHGGTGSCPGGGQWSQKACRGWPFLTARAHQPGGTGSPAQAAVGTHEGPARGSSSQRPGLTSLRGRGVLPRRRSVLMKGLRGAAVPNGPGSPARGDGGSSLGGGRCS